MNTVHVKKKGVILLVCVVVILLWLFSSSMPKIKHVEERIYQDLPVLVAEFIPSFEVEQSVDNRPPVSQSLVDYIGKFLDVKYRVEKNTENAGFYHSVTLCNHGDTIIPNGNWSIYFNLVIIPEFKRFPYPAQGALLGWSGMRLHQIAGGLYRLTPDIDRFKDLPPKGELRVSLTFEVWMVSRSDVFPNWFVSAPKTAAHVIQSTAREDFGFVEPFTKKEQFKRKPGDEYEPYTPEKRFSLASVVSDAKNRKSPYLLVPSPLVTDMLNDANQLNVDIKTWTIQVVEKDFMNEAQFLSGKTSIKVEEGSGSGSNVIIFKKEEIQIPDVKPHLLNEAYVLEVGIQKNVISIKSNAREGAFYGAVSLIMLNKQAPQLMGLKLPIGTIKDAPRYSYRGLMLDVGRNFRSKEEVLQTLEVMALYKLNKLHLHLTEDEGWRLEIPGIPELTKFGSKRCYDERSPEVKCLPPSLGSGPDSDSSGSGFYTTKDYQDILKYANDRHVMVIPEVDMPGHVRAAIKSMQQNPEFKLSDDNDTSKYIAIAGYRDNALNPCLDSTYKFIRHVMKTIQTLHADIQPLSLYHFGGDEVARGAWANSPKCKKMLEKEDDLKKYFVSRISEIASDLDLNLGAWEDGIMRDHRIPYNRTNFKKDMYGYAWNNIWEGLNIHRAHILANKGFKVVLCHGTHLYLDHAYEPDPDERGFYWAARYIDTQKSFGYMPERIYDNADFTSLGHPLSKEELCRDYTCVPLKNPENIIGIQAELWSETVRSKEHMHFMLYPRLLAVAERAWHKALWESEVSNDLRTRAKNKDWGDFVSFISQREFRRLEGLSIMYRIPPPGVRVKGKTLEAASIFPWLPIEYSTDDGDSWNPYQNPVDVSSFSTADHSFDVQFRSRSHDGKRFSRIVHVGV